MEKVLNENEIFIKHLIATTDLFSWISQWKILKYYSATGKNKSIFNFNINMSQRFMLGFPLNKAKYGSSPFLACQTREYSWASSIVWRKCVICLPEKRLYLVSNKIKTISNDYLPSYAISIEFSDEKILDMLSKYKSISIKHLWYEDELNDSEINLSNYESPMISNKNKEEVLPLFFVDSEEEIMREEDMSSNKTGDETILDSIRATLNIGNKEVKFLKGKNNPVVFSEEEAEFFKKFIKEIDYQKPKIRISVD